MKSRTLEDKKKPSRTKKYWLDYFYSLCLKADRSSDILSSARWFRSSPVEFLQPLSTKESKAYHQAVFEMHRLGFNLNSTVNGECFEWEE